MKCLRCFIIGHEWEFTERSLVTAEECRKVHARTRSKSLGHLGKATLPLPSLRGGQSGVC